MPVKQLSHPEAKGNPGVGIQNGRQQTPQLFKDPSLMVSHSPEASPGLPCYRRRPSIGQRRLRSGGFTFLPLIISEYFACLYVFRICLSIQNMAYFKPKCFSQIRRFLFSSGWITSNNVLTFFSCKGTEVGIHI